MIARVTETPRSALWLALALSTMPMAPPRLRMGTGRGRRMDDASRHGSGHPLQSGHEGAPLVVGNTMYIVEPFPNKLFALAGGSAPDHPAQPSKACIL
jgi:hypothetical protein